MGYDLNIPIHSRTHVDADSEILDLTTHNIKPQDWVKLWMETNPQLLGGWHGDPCENFEAFWALYRQSHPQHEVFRYHNDRLSHVVPICIHGDEGRAVKRTNYMVLSIESPLGSVEDPTLHCSCEGKLSQRRSIPSYESNEDNEDFQTVDPNLLERARRLTTNFKGHSYLSRWLIFGLGGWVYKKHPHIIDELLSILAGDLTHLFHDGVTLDNGKTFFGACVALKGDMDFHAKVMGLERCYSNVGTKSEIKLCHLCHAGDVNYKFEDYSETPGWLATLHATRPWDESNPPCLTSIPFDNSAPERLLAGDLFHIVKCGVARDVIGGCLILLLRLCFFDYHGLTVNIKDRFERAHSMFSLWCKANGKSAGLRSFTMAFFNMKKLISAPWASTKGSDSVLCLQWLQFTLKLNIGNPVVPGHSKLLKAMLQVCEAALGILMVHHHGLFMERACGRLLYGHILTFLRGYAYLGRQSINLNIRAFIQKPKCHALHHIGTNIRKQLLTNAQLILSPQMTSCDVNEDFLGRICRLSRRVGFRQCDLRVCQRYGYKIVALLRNRKLRNPAVKQLKRRRQ